jgi:hypothetical protein
MRTVARLAPTLMIEHADAFPAEIFWRPLVPPPVAPPMIRLDDNNQSPHLQRFLSDTGRQPLLRALCEDPSILIVSHPDRLEPITVYVREHFGMDIRWDEVFNGSFRVWRCTQQR